MFDDVRHGYAIWQYFDDVIVDKNQFLPAN